MRRTILSLMALVALVLVVVGGTASAKVVQCKPNVGCVGTNNDDRLIGTSGSDNMSALKGADVLKGLEGDDNAMRGHQGNDRLLGGPGEDHLGGGTGKDVLKGGAGFDDYFFFENNWGKEFIDDTPIVDTDINTGHLVQFNLVTNNLTINMTSGPGPEVKNETTGSILNWEDNLIDIVTTGKGDDTVTGREVGDNIQVPGPPGDQDTINAGGGDDFVYTVDGDGQDVIDCGSGSNDEVRKDAADMQTNCEHVS
jgi:RTX calcium-binding nonapeptide repeat (4 copies)